MMFSSRGEKFRFAEFPRLGQCRFNTSHLVLNCFVFLLLFFWHAKVITVFSLMVLLSIGVKMVFLLHCMQVQDRIIDKSTLFLIFAAS